MTTESDICIPFDPGSTTSTIYYVAEVLCASPKATPTCVEGAIWHRCCVCKGTGMERPSDGGLYWSTCTNCQGRGYILSPVESPERVTA